MENRSHALVAGFFVLLLSAVAAAGIWWFGERDVPMADYLVVSRGNVTGLNPQAAVRYRGILVGKVRAIRLNPYDPAEILIGIRVQRSVRITTATRARLAYQGVTGIAHILLEDDGSSQQVLIDPSGEVPRIAMDSSLLDRLGDAGGNLIAQSGELLVRLQGVVTDENQAQVRQILVNLERASARLADVGEQLSPAIAATMAVMGRTEALLSPDNVARVERSLDGVERAVGSADQLFVRGQKLADDYAALARRVDTLAASLAGQRGLGGAAARVERLAGDLERSNRQLQRVLQGLEESPNSLLVGAPVVPPGPGEAGFRPPATGDTKRGEKQR